MQKITTFLMKDKSLIPVGLAENFQYATTQATSDIMGKFNKVTKNNNLTENSANKLFPHIHFCRIVRNRFLHSHQVDLLLEADVIEYSEKDFLSNRHIVFSRTVTRLILLTIQHILAVYYKDSKRMTDLYLSINEDEADLQLSDVLLVLHLKETTH